MALEEPLVGDVEQGEDAKSIVELAKVEATNEDEEDEAATAPVINETLDPTPTEACVGPFTAAKRRAAAEGVPLAVDLSGESDADAGASSGSGPKSAPTLGRDRSIALKFRPELVDIGLSSADTDPSVGRIRPAFARTLFEFVQIRPDSGNFGRSRPVSVTFGRFRPEFQFCLKSF